MLNQRYFYSISIIASQNEKGCQSSYERQYHKQAHEAQDVESNDDISLLFPGILHALMLRINDNRTRLGLGTVLYALLGRINISLHFGLEFSDNFCTAVF